MCLTEREREREREREEKTGVDEIKNTRKEIESD